jgi:hypothetical protein
MFDRSYELLNKSTGPIRASVCIASEPFNYEYINPIDQKVNNFQCRLYRLISLYNNADYLIEELSVIATTYVKGEKRTIRLLFAPHYFMHMNLGFEPQVYQFPSVMDWFALGSQFIPYPGYGFATNAHATPIVYPHKDPYFNNSNITYKRFSWQVQPSKYPKCLHLFIRDSNKQFDNKAGHGWYEMIYKPIIAKVLHGGKNETV